MKHFLHSILMTFAILFAVQLDANEKTVNPITQIQENLIGDDQEPVHIEILHENATIEEGKPFSLIVRLNIDDKWHTYWKNPGDSGMPVSIDWTLPEGFEVKAIHWQAPERFDHDAVVGFGYEKEMVLLVDMQAPAKLTQGLTTSSQIPLSATVNWLACSDMNCLPGNTEIATTLTVSAEKPLAKSGEYFKEIRETLPATNDWDIKAHAADNNSIQLKIQAPKEHQNLYTSSYFCPEESDVIDHKAPNTFEVSKDQDCHYQISLNRLQTNQHIKGVLVLISESESGPIKKSLAIDLPIKDDALIGYLDPSEVTKKPINLDENLEEMQEPASEFEGNFGKALFFAFIGGMLLNLMPCVLPVLSLKIFSFVKMSGENRALCFKHGLSFSVGVLVSFWFLAGMLLILQALGSSVGWGFQLQEPIFVAILACVIFVLGLNLFGVMEIGTSVTSFAGNLKTKKEGLTSSFFSGVLATAIATPCTGPFLGSAVGYAVTLPSYLALLIFTVLGAGMAFPYLLLSAYPNLLRFIPKPGNWMITFKEIMGFIMMATTIWLLWVFEAETSTLSMMLLIGALLLLSISCWIYGKWTSPLKKKRVRKIGFLLSLAFVALALLTITAATKSEFTTSSVSKENEIASAWEPFSPERVKELQAQGIPVFVDFTAKWCLICQTNHMSLTTNQAEDKFKKAGVVRMKADWTKKDETITKELRKFGRNSVPLYVLYGTEPSEKPKVLPQVLTSDTVSRYLDELN